MIILIGRNYLRNANDIQNLELNEDFLLIVRIIRFVLVKSFEIKKWNAVTLWAWDVHVDNCAICKNHLLS